MNGRPDFNIEAMIQTPEPHPAREYCERHGISLGQVARRILRTEDETKLILNGVIKPIGKVEERLRTLLNGGR